MGISTTKAILYFARSPRAEARAKRWTGNPHRDLEIARALHRHTLHHLNASGLDVVQINEDGQRGRSFGERFHNAFQDVFDQGYQHVIAVGNDQAGIETTNWDQVQQALDGGAAVIGPDFRGGIYLLGISRHDFAKLNWLAIPWQQPTLFAVLEEQLANVLLLNKRHDLNEIRDIRVLIHSGFHSIVIRILQAILDTDVTSIHHPRISVSAYVPVLNGRAPPPQSAA